MIEYAMKVIEKTVATLAVIKKNRYIQRKLFMGHLSLNYRRLLRMYHPRQLSPGDLASDLANTSSNRSSYYTSCGSPNKPLAKIPAIECT